MDSEREPMSTWTPAPDVRPDFAKLLIELDDGAEIVAGSGLEGLNWIRQPGGEREQVHYGTMLALERQRWLRRGAVVDNLRHWTITNRGRRQAAHERGIHRPTLRERAATVLEAER